MKFLFIIVSFFTVTLLVSNSNAQNNALGAADHCTALTQETGYYYNNGFYQPSFQIVNKCEYPITAHYRTSNGKGACDQIYTKSIAPEEIFRLIIPQHRVGTPYFVKRCTDFYDPNVQAASRYKTCDEQDALSSCF